VTMRGQILRWNPAACTGEAAWIAGRNPPLGLLNEVEDARSPRFVQVPRRGGDRSGGVAGIEVRRGLLLSLRHHPCGIRLSRHAPWSEQFALQIVLGFPGLSIVDLPTNFHAFVKHLSTGLQFLVRHFIAMACHWLILWLLGGRVSPSTSRACRAFIIMYRPHAAREDADLFSDLFSETFAKSYQNTIIKSICY